MMSPNEAGQSRFDTVLKMLLIAFVSLLAFSSGVYFGREMTEKDYKYKQAAAEFNTHSKDAASEKHEDYALSEESNPVTDEDVETLATNAVKAHGGDDHGEAKRETASESSHAPAAAEDHGDAHAAAPKHEAKAASKQETKHEAKHEEKAAAPAPKAAPKAHAADDHHDEAAPAKSAAASKSAKPDLKGVQEAARRVAANETPSHAAPAAKSENRVPQSLPKSVGAAKDIEYTVQVASYPSLDEAKAHANQLVSKGFPAYPVEAQVKGKSWFRVSVGSFKSQKEAGEYRSTLMKEAALKSAIVQKIQR